MNMNHQNTELKRGLRRVPGNRIAERERVIPVTDGLKIITLLLLYESRDAERQRQVPMPSGGTAIALLQREVWVDLSGYSETLQLKFSNSRGNNIDSIFR